MRFEKILTFLKGIEEESQERIQEMVVGVRMSDRWVRSEVQAVKMGRNTHNQEMLRSFH